MQKVYFFCSIESIIEINCIGNDKEMSYLCIARRPQRIATEIMIIN